jgi:hypothetical protein
MKPNWFVRVLLAKLGLYIALIQLWTNAHAQPLNSWNLVLSNSPVPITCMAYGNGTFVGAGSGFWFVSHDGTNWATYASPPFISQNGMPMEFLLFIPYMGGFWSHPMAWLGNTCRACLQPSH